MVFSRDQIERGIQGQTKDVEINGPATETREKKGKERKTK